MFRAKPLAGDVGMKITSISRISDVCGIYLAQWLYLGRGGVCVPLRHFNSYSDGPPYRRWLYLRGRMGGGVPQDTLISM